MSAEELLLASARGDQEAFGRLYDLTAPRVHGLVLRLLKDAHQAEEVTQECFLQAWRTAARYDPDRGQALTWLLTMAHRRAVDRVRASEATRRREHGYGRRSAVPEYDSTAELATDRLQAQQVRTALAGLAEGQREALSMAYFEGATHREVADRLEIPLGTAKSRIRDGLLQLRARLEGAHRDG